MNSYESDSRARVFISCGQRRDSDEPSIAARVRNALEELGYNTYVATEEQTLRGVKENIFRQIETSEYFVFIDFKREPLANQAGAHRGSLFSHQELALASYLNLELVALQEKGVKREDGLMGFIQGNSIEFVDRSTIPSLVVEQITKRKWSPAWKNRLLLHREPGQYVDASDRRFFHVEVQNLHDRKSARHCYVYLDQVRDLQTGEPIPMPRVEFKWAGYEFPNAMIAPGRNKPFDAFNVVRQSPDRLCFYFHSEANELGPPIRSPGEYLMTYEVLCEDFPPARASFVLHFAERLEDITFRPAPRV